MSCVSVNDLISFKTAINQVNSNDKKPVNSPFFAKGQEFTLHEDFDKPVAIELENFEFDLD